MTIGETTTGSGPQAAATEADPVLSIHDLTVDYPLRGRKGVLHAVNGVDLTLAPGRTLGLVGESGCGKTTLVKTILGLQKATKGEVVLAGEDLLSLKRSEWRSRRPQMQVVFQDPYTSLDPRMTVHDIIAEPLRIHHRYTRERVVELLENVGMSADQLERKSGTFSGGQRQRLGIARALALDPSVLVLDEPVSSLDKSIQAQVINLLTRLQAERGLSYLFISHDLSVVRHMSHTVAVMYLGRIVESGTRAQVFGAPQHPYTRALIDAVPIARPHGRVERRRPSIRGEFPDPAAQPSGCPFRMRCPKAQDLCATTIPAPDQYNADGHRAACHFPG